MNRSKQIGGLTEILQSQLEEQCLTRLAVIRFLPDGVVIVMTVLDSVIEDRRFGGQPVVESSQMYLSSVPLVRSLW